MHMDTPQDQQLPLRPPPPSSMQLPPLSPLDMSELPVRHENHANAEERRHRTQRRRDIDVANTLAAMCSESSPIHGSFSSEYSDKSLPRLPELDYISLESLALHYARSSADRLRPRPVEYALRATPRSYYDGNQPLPPTNQQRQYYYHYYSTPFSSVPVPKRKSPVRETRGSSKYTIEQKDFVDYWHIDRNGRWDEVAREYNMQFKDQKRSSGGLAGAWYRENKMIPFLDKHGMLTFDENNELCTMEVPVSAAKWILQSIKSIGLLSTHPERAIEYEWVTKEHKEKIFITAHARRVQLDAVARERRQNVQARSHVGMFNSAELIPSQGLYPMMRSGGMDMGMGRGSIFT